MAINNARQILPEADPNDILTYEPINPNQLAMGQQYFNFMLYHQNQNHLVRTFPIPQQFVNNTLQHNAYEHTNGISVPLASQNTFNQIVPLNWNGFIISYYIRCQRPNNNLERFEYTERHLFISGFVNIQYEQIVTHRDMDGTIISIIQRKQTNYVINEIVNGENQNK